MGKNKVDIMIEKQLISKLDDKGFEIPDSTPMALPIGITRPPTIQEQIQRMVKYAVSQVAMNEGHETFEEADDFNVGDDPELSSPYELDDERQNARFKDFVEEQPDPNVRPISEPEPPAKPVALKAQKKKTPKPAASPAPSAGDDDAPGDDQ